MMKKPLSFLLMSLTFCSPLFASYSFAAGEEEEGLREPGAPTPIREENIVLSFPKEGEPEEESPRNREGELSGDEGESGEEPSLLPAPVEGALPKAGRQKPDLHHVAALLALQQAQELAQAKETSDRQVGQAASGAGSPSAAASAIAAKPFVGGEASWWQQEQIDTSGAPVFPPSERKPSAAAQEAEPGEEGELSRKQLKMQRLQAQYPTLTLSQIRAEERKRAKEKAVLAALQKDTADAAAKSSPSAQASERVAASAGSPQPSPVKKDKASTQEKDNKQSKNAAAAASPVAEPKAPPAGAQKPGGKKGGKKGKVQSEEEDIFAEFLPSAAPAPQKPVTPPQVSKQAIETTLGLKSKDVKEAASWFKKGAGKGDPAAMFHLGVSCKAGKGVPQDYKKAAEWFKKAADLGNADAMNDLGTCFTHGQGVVKDDVKAAEWYRKATALHHPRAHTNLGQCYETGKGVSQNWETAALLYHTAAHINDALGMYHLSRFLEKGFFPQERHPALYWLEKSAAAGYLLAIDELAKKQSRKGAQDKAPKSNPSAPAAQGLPEALLRTITAHGGTVIASQTTSKGHKKNREAQKVSGGHPATASVPPPVQKPENDPNVSNAFSLLLAAAHSEENTHFQSALRATLDLPTADSQQKTAAQPAAQQALKELGEQSAQTQDASSLPIASAPTAAAAASPVVVPSTPSAAALKPSPPLGSPKAIIESLNKDLEKSRAVKPDKSPGAGEYQLGMMRLESDPTAANLREAEMFLDKAARRGHEKAREELEKLRATLDKTHPLRTRWHI